MIFATVYFLLPQGQFSQPLSLLDAVYFSVITITTTGFGDIAAHGNVAKLCVSVEATAGITIVGLFLASLWRDFTVRVEATQAAQLFRAQRAMSLASLLVYWRYIETTIVQYRKVAAAVTTPLRRRNGPLKYNAAFRFCDLQDLMTTPSGPGDGTQRTLLETYFEMEDRLEGDLKYLLQNDVIAEFTLVRGLLINVLSLLRAFELREMLLSMQDARLREELRHAIAATTKEPDAEQERLNLIAPVVMFASHVRRTQQALDELTAAMGKLLSEPAGEMPKPNGMLRTVPMPVSASA
jgi:hypothetical protein